MELNNLVVSYCLSRNVTHVLPTLLTTKASELEFAKSNLVHAGASQRDRIALLQKPAAVMYATRNEDLSAAPHDESIIGADGHLSNTFAAAEYGGWGR